jgi:hypothetical protein
MKLSYFLKVTYPIATVMARIHSPAVVIRAPRSMVLAVYDTVGTFALFIFSDLSSQLIYLLGILGWLEC